MTVMTVISSMGDVATRPGQGVVNFTLLGRILRLRQMELPRSEFVDDYPLKVAIERRVRQELYPCSND